MPARRLAPEIMVEGDDAVHFRARDVERFGDRRDGVFRDVADRFLHRVQDRQQPPLAHSDGGR